MPRAAGKLTAAVDENVYFTTHGGSIAVDAVEVKATVPGSDLSRHTPRFPRELAITTDAPLGVATVGEPVRATVRSSDAAAATVL